MQRLYLLDKERLQITVAVVMAVVVVCVCGGVGADRLTVPRDYGVKLCGREFIRAVIFTCGGSRWKRSLDQHLDPFQINYYSDVTQGEDNKRSWHQNNVRETDGVPSPPLAPSLRGSLADLLAARGRDAVSPVRAQDFLRQVHLSVTSEEQGEQSNVQRPINVSSSKRKRNFSLGVAGMCCNQGCTKNDIGHLC